MHMKNALQLSLIVAAVLPLHPHANYHDRDTTDSTDGYPRIIRTSNWPDLEGGSIAVEQVLRKNGDGSFTYRFSEQSTATQLYHHAFCESDGATPGQSDSILGGSHVVGGLACFRTTMTESATPSVISIPRSRSR